MKVKIAQIIDVDVPANASNDEIFKLIDEELAPEGKLRYNLDFVIESIDDEDHLLVGETVGN